MERGKPLERKTALKRGDSQLKRTELKRGESRLRRSRWKPKPTVDPVTPATRRAVRARSRGRCEARVIRTCTGVAEHVHHRKLRRYGDHRACNLLDVCHRCHDHIHANPRWSYRWGWLVRQADDPTTRLAGHDENGYAPTDVHDMRQSELP
jgi:hypothetical protein